MVAGVYRSLAPGGFWLCADIRASSHVVKNLDYDPTNNYYVCRKPD